MRRIKISGGPAPCDIHVTDAETGAMIPGVTAFTVSADAKDGGFARATLTCFAEVDLVAEEAEHA